MNLYNNPYNLYPTLWNLSIYCMLIIFLPQYLVEIGFLLP